MKASRRTQPYRSKRSRPAGATLKAMLRGAPAYMPNPQQVKRTAQKRSRRRRGLARLSDTRGQ